MTRKVLAIMAKAPTDLVLRAIESARPYVDSVCLVVAPDDPLTKLELPIPGRIVEEPWCGFGETRTKTLRHAEHDGDWVVMIDADDVLAPGGSLPGLSADSYEIPIDCKFRGGRWRWIRHGHLMRAGAGCSWSSGLHEAMNAPESAKLARWDGLIYCVDQTRLTRTTTHSYAKDAEQLSANLTDSRSAYYYAQSLRDAGRHVEAYRAFLARAEMEGSHEETFWALLWAAKLAPFVGVSRDEVILRHLNAIAYAPERAEPLHSLALVYREWSEYELAKGYMRMADSKPYPVEARSFVDLGCYSYAALHAAGIES